MEKPVWNILPALPDMEWYFWVFCFVSYLCARCLAILFLVGLSWQMQTGVSIILSWRNLIWHILYVWVILICINDPAGKTDVIHKNKAWKIGPRLTLVKLEIQVKNSLGYHTCHSIEPVRCWKEWEMAWVPFTIWYSSKLVMTIPLASWR